MVYSYNGILYNNENEWTTTHVRKNEFHKNKCWAREDTHTENGSSHIKLYNSHTEIIFFRYIYMMMIYMMMMIKVAQSCPALCDPMDYIVHGILQARILEWVAFPFSRGSSQPRDRTQVSHIAGGLFTSWATREAHRRYNNKENKDIIIMNVRRMVTFREEDRVVTREGHTWSLWKSGHVLLLWTAWLLHVCSLYNYLFKCLVIFMHF